MENEIKIREGTRKVIEARRRFDEFFDSISEATDNDTMQTNGIEFSVDIEPLLLDIMCILDKAVGISVIHSLCHSCETEL